MGGFGLADGMVWGRFFFWLKVLIMVVWFGFFLFESFFVVWGVFMLQLLGGGVQGLLMGLGILFWLQAKTGSLWVEKRSKHGAFVAFVGIFHKIIESHQKNHRTSPKQPRK